MLLTILLQRSLYASNATGLQTDSTLCATSSASSEFDRRSLPNSAMRSSIPLPRNDGLQLRRKGDKICCKVNVNHLPGLLQRIRPGS